MEEKIDDDVLRILEEKKRTERREVVEFIDFEFAMLRTFTSNCADNILK